MLVLVLFLAACDPGGSGGGPSDQARPNHPSPGSVGPRTGRVADGENERARLSTAPTDPTALAGSAGAGCAALPPLGTQLAQLLLVGFPGTRAGAVSRRLVDRGGRTR